jgi:hypothetical protein
MPNTETNEPVVLNTPEQIQRYAELSTLYALKFECLGMKRRGVSVYSTVKAKYNLKGNKQSVYNQLKLILGL